MGVSMRAYDLVQSKQWVEVKFFVLFG
eukprot:SAG11_NODE_23400_length_389_cov_0.920690_1_plen_26_part_10